MNDRLKEIEDQMAELEAEIADLRNRQQDLAIEEDIAMAKLARLEEEYAIGD